MFLIAILETTQPLFVGGNSRYNHNQGGNSKCLNKVKNYKTLLN